MPRRMMSDSTDTPPNQKLCNRRAVFHTRGLENLAHRPLVRFELASNGNESHHAIDGTGIGLLQATLQWRGETDCSWSVFPPE